MGGDEAAFAAIESAPPQPPSRPVAGRAAANHRPQRELRPTFRKSSMLAIIDEGGRITRQSARILVLGAGLLLLPVAALDLVASRAVSDAEGGIGAVLPALSVIAGSEAEADGYWLAGIIAVVASSLLTSMIGALAAAVVVEGRTGSSIDLWSGLAAVGRRSPSLLAAWSIGHSWAIIAALLVDGVPWLAAIVALTGAVAIVLTLYVSPVIVIEGLGPIAALRRSRNLTRGSFGRLAVLALVTGFLGLWLRGSLALLPALAEATGLITFGSLGWIAEGIGGQLGLLISAPIVGAATALSYLDTRVRREALDIVAAIPEAFDVR